MELLEVGLAKPDASLLARAIARQKSRQAPRVPYFVRGRLAMMRMDDGSGVADGRTRKTRPERAGGAASGHPGNPVNNQRPVKSKTRFTCFWAP